jgi:hypothetical protein
MCVPWNRAGARPKRHLIILMPTLIPQPSRLAPPLVSHLTGHVTGQMDGQRAVTGHVTGHVRHDRFHALTPTRNKPSFTPRRSGERAGRGCVSHDYGAVRMCACQGTAQVNVQREITANPKRYRATGICTANPTTHGYSRILAANTRLATPPGE